MDKPTTEQELFSELLQFFLGDLPQVESRNNREVHHHKCSNPYCALIWSHSRRDLPTREVFIKGHHCYRCGAPAIETKDGDAFAKCDAQGNILE